jgi:SDR family mycofactocin-dependent oxidoreductase
MKRLDGKVVLITGAARGQGRSHALRLAGEGADLVLSDICGPVEHSEIRQSTPDDLAETVRHVEALGEGTRVIARQVDVRDLAALEQLAADAVGELGRLDVVIANAGILNWGEVADITPEMWQAVIDVNLTGVFNTVKATVQHLIDQGQGGSIILISSSAGIKGQPLTLPYTAAKHGVTGMAKALANELGPHDIRVNSVHPAGVLTPMGAEVPALQALIGKHAETLGPIFMNSLPHEMMEPEEVSATVAWLASDDSRMVTGTQVRVDLGTCNR